MTMQSLAVPLTEWANRIADWREEKGFYTPPSWDDTPAEPEATCADWALAKLALVHTEICELRQGLEEGDLDNVKEEIADIAIRVLDLMGSAGEVPLPTEALTEPGGEIYATISLKGLSELIPLMHEHAATASECIRKHRRRGASVALVHLLQCCALAARQTDEHLLSLIGAKMEVNYGRQQRHGKKTAA